jgi:hypothetical protein
VTAATAPFRPRPAGPPAGVFVQGDADAAPQVAVGGGGMVAVGGPLARSSQQEPAQERAGEAGVRGRLARELVL